MTAIDSIRKTNLLIDDYETVEQLMIDFAKYHVEQALLKASKEILVQDECDSNIELNHIIVLSDGFDDLHEITVNKISVLTAYPLDNIK